MMDEVYPKTYVKLATLAATQSLQDSLSIFPVTYDLLTIVTMEPGCKP